MASPGVKQEVKKECEGDKPGLELVENPKSTKRTKTTDFGLAHTWEDSRLIRELLRENGKLVRWLSPEQINVINLETLGLNTSLMCTVADYHCSKTKIPKAPGIDFLKAQARGKSKSQNMLIIYKTSTYPQELKLF